MVPVRWITSTTIWSSWRVKSKSSTLSPKSWSSHEGINLNNLTGKIGRPWNIFIWINMKRSSSSENCFGWKDRLLFNIVWVYVEKVIDGCKKACCTCDGYTYHGQVLCMLNASIKIDPTFSMQHTPLKTLLSLKYSMF